MTQRQFQTLLGTALGLGLCVVIMGAWVRLSDAGLACPDWPGCYGSLLVPKPEIAARHSAHADQPLEVGKAWKEMAHRYAAGVLGMLILLIAVVAWHQRLGLRRVAGLCAILVVFQALLGMWTVTLLLAPLVVVLHLLGGVAVVSLLLWMWLEQRATGKPPIEPAASGLAGWAGVGLVVLLLQIGLGGWTSANYAGLACPDFPTCQGQWWPSGMDFRQGFTAWREEGLTAWPAGGGHTAIAVAHRIGALVTLLVVTGIACACLRRGGNGSNVGHARLRTVAWIMLALVFIQWALGISTVLLRVPLVVANGHSTVAVLLLLCMVALLHGARAGSAGAGTPGTMNKPMNGRRSA